MRPRTQNSCKLFFVQKEQFMIVLGDVNGIKKCMCIVCARDNTHYSFLVHETCAQIQYNSNAKRIIKIFRNQMLWERLFYFVLFK